MAMDNSPVLDDVPIFEHHAKRGFPIAMLIAGGTPIAVSSIFCVVGLVLFLLGYDFAKIHEEKLNDSRQTNRYLLLGSSFKWIPHEKPLSRYVSHWTTFLFN